MNSKMMGDIFRKFGVVKDVYIPLKRRKVRNTRFAFVRYDCEVAAEIAVQKANGIWMEDKQLVVKHTDYGKKAMEVKTQYHPQTKGFPNGRKDECSVWKQAAGVRTFAEVIKNNNGMERGIVSVQCNELSSSKKHQKNKGRKRVVSKSSGKKIKEMEQGYLQLPKRYSHKGASSSKLGPKGVLWRAAAVVASGSESTTSGIARSRSLLKEAQGTIQMGKLLEINYKGKEEEVLARIMDLEAKDRARRGGVLVPAA
ncbi:serine/arginine-rich splicing factor 2-like [Camellia sinensis]|uniref:serine/arginine-rich splicing factor 2-like n=1 Tax=Camellia sinensis TaxID=4442 RepID=UPI001036423A|nr:serine/arginine-rich splicing factor 2-like [Camellia sinensis]